ncbi:MAG: hypothetical protein RIQ52_2081 [Pseudomonadota bacterium]
MDAMTRRAIMAGVIGNALEWYDFALYGHFSITIGRLFFPPEDATTATLAAFAVFSVSFFLRPVGAVIFSLIGDRLGRKRALSISILGMALPTAGIGLLPSYADLGLTATALLIFLRMLQGVAMGGEMGGAVTYVMEHVAPERRGLVSAFIQSSTCLGLLCGALVAVSVSMLMPETQFEAWGWRIPFLLGLVAAWAGWRIRSHMPESDHFEGIRLSGALLDNPIRQVLARNRLSLLIGLLWLMPMTSCFFLAFVYFNSYMIGGFGYSSQHALMMTSAALTASAAVTILVGWLADRWCTMQTLAVGSGLMVLLVQPLVSLLSGSDGAGMMWLSYMALSALIGCYTSVVFTRVAELFPTEVRYSGVSLVLNVASPVFGSTVPVLAVWLVSHYGTTFGFQLLGSYVMLLAGGAALGVRTYYRLRHRLPQLALDQSPV